MPQQKIRIAIADDHQICRDGLISMFDPQRHVVVGEADNGHGIIEIAKNSIPDIIFMDIQMSKLNGIEATKIITANFPTINIIALSIFGQDIYISEMIKAGACGYILKSASKSEILESIKVVNSNQQYFCKNSILTYTKLAKNQKRNNKTRSLYDLSDTELKIIQLLCEEYSSESIGRLLFLSKRTIDGSRLRIQSKLNVTTTAGIVRFALENGIYSLTKE